MDQCAGTCNGSSMIAKMMAKMIGVTMDVKDKIMVF